MKTEREYILEEMSEPEYYANMSDIEMLDDLEAQVYSSHGDECVIDWRDRLKADLNLNGYAIDMLNGANKGDK